MPYAQVVIGPPGSGKTTYCNGMQQFLTALGRKVAVVNLDPANDFVPYKCDINIADLITLEDAMDNLKLGPNGGMMYCIEYLENNLDWLIEECKKFPDHYFIFDFPGQVELYTHNSAVKSIVDKLQKLDFRLVAVHLVDAHYCTDPTKYISVLLLSLKTMIMLELPHINVLSKMDLIEAYGKLAFSLDFYTEVMNLDYLLNHLNQDAFGKRFTELNRALCELIEDFNLVGFYTLCIEDKASVTNLLRVIDKANGYVFGSLEQGNESIMLTAMRSGTGYQEDVFDVQEKYIDFKDYYNEMGLDETIRESNPPSE